MQTVLVTGAGGFIGKRVVSKLISDGYKVVAMVRPGSLVYFSPDKNLTILRADILDYGSYCDKLAYVDAVVHLAANKYHPKLSFLVNEVGAKNIVRLFEDNKLKGNRLVNISSQSTKIRFKGVYGRSKQASDDILSSSPKIALTTLKPSLVYGSDKESLFQTIAKFSVNYPFVPVVGNGKWVLYPVDVDDVADSILLCLKNDKSIGKTYDIGCEKGIAFNQLVNLIQKEIGIRRKILNVPFPIGLFGVFFVTRLIPSLPITVDNVLGSNQDTHCSPGYAMRDLGFKPMSLEMGIRKYLSNSVQKVRVAVVGLGKMGILHSTILSVIEKAQIVAIIDNKNDLGKTANSMGIKVGFFTSLQDAISKTKVDAVYICTPTFNHWEIIETCLINKLPYFVEKPMFNDILLFNKILDKKYDKLNKLSSVGYFWVYKREVMFAKKLISEGLVGKIDSYNVDLQHSEVFGPKKGWLFTKKLSGGGVLMNPGPHAFSVIRYLFGKGEVVKSNIKYLYGNEVEDEAQITLKHSLGVMGNLKASWSIKDTPVLKINFKVVGDKGSVEFKDGKFIFTRGSTKRVYNYSDIPRNYSAFNLNPKSGSDAYFHEDELFINCLLGGKENLLNIYFAKDIEELIHQSYEKAI